MHDFQNGLLKIQKDLTKHKEVFNEYKEQDETRVTKMFREKLAKNKTPDREKFKKKGRETDLGLTEYLKREKVPKNREDSDSSGDSVSEVTRRSKKSTPVHNNPIEDSDGKRKLRKHQRQF